MKSVVQVTWHGYRDAFLFVHVPCGPLIFYYHGNFVFAWCAKNEIAAIRFKPYTEG